MTRDAPPTTPRVVLALGAGSPMETAVRLACGLAAGRGWPLAALFVEDADLLRAAALPFTRELGAFSAVRRPFETSGMVAAHAAASADLSRRVRAEAARTGVDATVNVVHGRALETGLVRASASDLLLVSVSGWHPTPPDAFARRALRMLVAAEGRSGAIDPALVATALSVPVLDTHRSPGAIVRAFADEGADLVAMSRTVLDTLLEDLLASLRARGGLVLVLPGATDRVDPLPAGAASG